MQQRQPKNKFDSVEDYENEGLLEVAAEVKEVDYQILPADVKNSKPSLQGLPNDLLNLIDFFLEKKDRAALRSTSRRLSGLEGKGVMLKLSLFPPPLHAIENSKDACYWTVGMGLHFLRSHSGAFVVTIPLAIVCCSISLPVCLCACAWGCGRDIANGYNDARIIKKRPEEPEAGYVQWTTTQDPLALPPTQKMT